nr:hypothetical protein [Deltaproteobacteria bacterium]
MPCAPAAFCIGGAHCGPPIGCIDAAGPWFCIIGVIIGGAAGPGAEAPGPEAFCVPMRPWMKFTRWGAMPAAMSEAICGFIPMRAASISPTLPATTPLKPPSRAPPRPPPPSIPDRAPVMALAVIPPPSSPAALPGGPASACWSACAAPSPATPRVCWAMAGFIPCCC